MEHSSDVPNDPETQAIADQSRFWRRDYVREMHAFLGASACRKLGIYELPEGFVLSVIVPIFNEQNTVATVIQRLRETGMPMQLVLVDDGSKDGTAKAMRFFAEDPDVTICTHEKNRGKGAAIRTGLENASGDVIVIQDADQEYDPSDFRFLLQPLLAGEADIVYGTRYGHYDRQLSPWWHQAVNGTITFLASLAVGIRLSDVETCYKMAPKKHFETIMPKLKENRFGIEIEVTARWARAGLRFTERPIRYQHRWYDAGKKIGWKDGVSALWCILKYGFFRR